MNSILLSFVISFSHPWFYVETLHHLFLKPYINQQFENFGKNLSHAFIESLYLWDERCLQCVS